MKDRDELKRECRKILSEDIISLIKIQPFHSKFLLNCNKVILDEEDMLSCKVPIAAVNIEHGKVNLFINAKSYTNLMKSQRLFVLIHEMMHIELGHFLRWEGKNIELFNIATDLAINQLIPNNKEISPINGMVTIESVKENFDIDVVPELKDADFYYKFLKNELEKQGMNVDESNGGSGIVEIPEELREIFEKFREEMMNGTNNNGFEELDWHIQWKENKGNKKSNEAIIKEQVKQALRRDAGTIPGNLRTDLENWVESQVNWAVIFRQYSAKVINWNKRTTWRKVNRRHELLKGVRREKKWRVAFCVDTSASVTNEELKQAASEIHSMWQKGAEVTVFECDTKLQDVYEYEGRINEISFKGRGGTSLIPPFQKIENDGMDFDLIVYLTDGGGEAPQEKFKIPTIWLLTPNGERPYDVNFQKIEWGKEIKLN